MLPRPIVWQVLLFAGCASVTPSVTFQPVEDLRTTEPRSLAEGGYGQPLVLPAGVSLATALSGYEDLDRPELPNKRFELHLIVVDARPLGAGRHIDPLFDEVVLVDDEGARFPCARASVPVTRAGGNAGAADAGATAEGDGAGADTIVEAAGDAPRRHDYTMVFDLPPSYRFRSVLAVTVHWALQLDGEVVRVSSRFRV